MIMTKDFDVITEFPINVDEEGEGNQNIYPDDEFITYDKLLYPRLNCIV